MGIVAESTVLDQIEESTDREWLLAVVAAAQKRLEWLKANRGVVNVVCQDGTWYAVLPDKNANGRNKGYRLGDRMAPAAVLRRAGRKPPEPLQFEITEHDAKKSAQIGRIETPGAKNRYYDVAAYNQARSNWHEWRELAGDPAAVAFGIPVSGMKILRKIEGQGYQIRFPE